MPHDRETGVKILVLTGSIGMGKSTVGGMFAALGVPLFDADATVHRLYAPGGRAVPEIAALFPEAVQDGRVDRTILSKLVLNDAAKIRALEQIVHPLVQEERGHFLAAARQRGEKLVVLDIPLYFEGGAKKTAPDGSGINAVAVVSAPEEAQAARVLARPGMTEEKFAAILAKQVPDAEKRALADTVIDTGTDMASTEAQVRALVARLRGDA